MNHIQLHFEITEDFRLKSITVISNTTGLPNDTTMLRNLTNAVIRALYIPEEDNAVSGLLSELDIKTED